MSRRILLTSFGWNDSGGGTIVPRVVAPELVRRGWDVTVFHAATDPMPGAPAYAVREWEEDGVRLIGVHNRPHDVFDVGRPDREVDDPPATAAFAEALDRVRPDVVHVHNLHNLGAGLLDQLAARGLPSFFSTHNYWLVCPRAYLVDGRGRICDGPPDRGAGCASCVGGQDRAGHAARLAAIRDRFRRSMTACLAVSHAMRRTLLAAGYPADLVDVVRQSVPAADATWAALGRDRRPGRVGERLTVGFFGSALPHKGPQQLVRAAQLARADVRVLVFGEITPSFSAALQRLDSRGIVELRGSFGPGDLPSLLAEVDAAATPSQWWDCAPLMAAECLAGRVPLLAPRLGGLGEAIRHEVDGLHFDALSDVDLAAQLDRLAAEDGLLERLQAGIAPPRPFAAYVDDLEATYAGGRPGRVAPAVEVPDPAVTWRGRFAAGESLATINDEVCARLPAHGVRLGRERPLPHAADVEVRHAWPPDFRPAASGRLALVQPWEFGAIPLEWVEPLGRDVDEVWVPSEHVRRMYLAAGVEGDRVHVVPNGVDLDVFAPAGPRADLGLPAGTRTLLYVGPPMARKGFDVLLAAFRRAFRRDDPVALVVKDVGLDGAYRGVGREALQAAAADAGGPRVVHLTDELDRPGVAALLRAADALVLPYRGEGFAMPVLEAMACGVPVVVTAGGPTDEFCPAAAGWRVPSERRPLSDGRVDGRACAGQPWMLEPNADALVDVLLEVGTVPAGELAARGAAGRVAAEALGWDVIAAQYAGRLRALAARPRRTGVVPVEPDLELGEGPVVLATPAWRGEDRLPELLAAWTRTTRAGGPGTLVLLADPAVDGDAGALEARVLATGADLSDCADIAIHLATAAPGRDEGLHAAADAYVPLHAACAGHTRLAREVVAPAALGTWLEARTAVPA